MSEVTHEGGRVEDNYDLHEDNHALLEQFSEFVKKTNAASAANRRSNVRAWLKWCERNDVDASEPRKADFLLHLDEVAPVDDGDGRMDAKEIEGLSHTAFGSRVNSISKFYTWANGRELVATHPAENFSLDDSNYEVDPNVSQKYRVLRPKNPEDGSKAILSIPQDRIRRVAEHAKSDRDELIIRLFQQTGIRASEMESIKMEDVDRDDRSILIYSSKAKKKDSNYTRRVYYQPNLDYLLDEWELQREEWADRYNSDHLFCSMHDGKIAAGSLSGFVRDAAKKAGENEVMYIDAAGRKRWLITAHTLRHSFISYCVNEAEIPLPTVAELAGHKKVDTTMDYVSTKEDEKKRFVRERGPGS